MHLFDANAAQSNWEEKYVYSAGKGVKNGAWCCWSRRCVGRRLTDFSSIASCPILCTKRSSFRDMLLISLQGRRILLRLFSGQILSQHLGRWNWQRSGASPKIISRVRSTPVCCPNYKTNSKGAFFWENPKTDLWSQIIRILHYPKKTEDPKKDHLPWQRHVLVLLVGKKQTNWSSQRRQEERGTWAMNEYTKLIYFGLKHERFSNRTHFLG